MTHEASLLRSNPHLLITRTRSKCEAFCSTLEQAGLQVSAIPIQQTRATLSQEEMNLHLKGLASWDGLLLTSAASVRFFLQPLLQMLDTYDASERSAVLAWLSSHLFCVGQATAQACEALGFSPSLIPEKQDALGLIAALQQRGSQQGKRYLFPCSTEARPTLSQGLEALGATVFRLHVYTVVSMSLPESVRALLLAGDIDMVAVNSPSQFAALCAAMEMAPSTWRASLRWAAIGPTTAEALRQAGLEPWLVSPKPSMQAFAEAIREALYPQTFSNPKENP
ncbi:MAG: uroporphyrinogen-III synthase [Myxococcales bacterium]|nr:uroporphyrinogen-III synthase [Myxococcales bacterium]